MAPKQSSPKSFEDQLLRLEELVETLDRGDVPLEEMLRLYEEGAELVKQSQAALLNAEQKITRIKMSAEDENDDSDEDADSEDRGLFGDSAA